MGILFNIFVVWNFVIETARFLIQTAATSREGPIRVRIYLDQALNHHLVGIRESTLGRIHIAHELRADVVEMLRALEKHL